MILAAIPSIVSLYVSWTTVRSPEKMVLARRGARAAASKKLWTRREVARALRPGQERSLHRLTEHILPVVHARVARVLVACPLPCAHLRSEVEDLTQEVFAHLFENNARILRGWNPERGASLKNYVGLVAERRVRSLLRSGRWTHWREQPSTVRDIESHALPVESPARRTADQQYWECVVDGARSRLTARGVEMMDLLMIEQRPIAEVAELTGMTNASLYAWRSRLQKLMRELAHDLRLADLSAVSS